MKVIDELEARLTEIMREGRGHPEVAAMPTSVGRGTAMLARYEGMIDAAKRARREAIEECIAVVENGHVGRDDDLHDIAKDIADDLRALLEREEP